ncbi:hypothetical protein E4P82_10990 [Candidatus Competibacter phosphatis]|uniref:Uncharacterized protein n=1 Tax=Candidatus Competibacter phosphatis TaxID=221280 RepID=A0ABX1TJW6_9GAMM|nr:hypothetical protein [Candidatus Competibacter phosphatis]
MSFACLDCRKSFKREFLLSMGCPKQMSCPDCGSPAYNFGRHFKAPKKTDIKQWKKVRFLFEHGFWFQRIYDKANRYQIIEYPKTMEGAREFVEAYKEYAIK